MASPKIKIKRGSTFPLQTNFVAGELALNTSTNALYAAILDNGGPLTGAGPSAGTVTVGTPVAVADGWTVTLTSSGSNFSVPSGSVISVTGSTTATVGPLVPDAITPGTAITGPYTSATGLSTTTSGGGTGLTVTVAHTSGTTYTSANTTITVVAGGSGYIALDTITVSGANNALGSGSTSATHNLVFTLPANFNVSLGGVVTSNAASAVATLSISSKGSAPRPGVLTGTVQYAPGLKWVGAEIEDYTGLLSANFGSRTKLATQGAIKDYVSTVTSTGVTVTDTLSTDTATFYPTFISGTASTALRVDTSSTALTYVPSSGTLTAPSFSGPLSGNSTGLHTGALTTNGINEINVTGGNVTLSPVGVTSPTVTISPTGTSSAGAVVISPTGGSGTAGTVTISPTGTLTLGKLTVGTTLLGNLTASGADQNVAMSPSGTGTVTISPSGTTGTVTISPASTLTLGTASVTTSLLGNLSAGGALASITPTGVLTLGTAAVATNLVGNLTASGSVALSPASLAVTISPSGTGTVAISPAGALTINPTTASTINNCSIGATTASTGRFTDLTATASATINGNFTVNGTQTYLNTTVMTVTDKNIELGFGTGTTGGVVSASFTFALIPFPAHTGTVSRIGTSGNKWKITFPNTTSIPVGIRPGTELSSGIGSGAGYLGTSATVTSITPTEIFYNSAGTPVAGTNTGLTVTNDYISSTITLSTGTTANMVVGSAVTGTLSSGSLNTATGGCSVGSILSGTTFTIVNRGAIAGTVSSASAIATGAATDTTADGGGITVKGTTDKTLSWVSSTKNWTFNQGLEVSAVVTNPGLTVNTFDSTGAAMVGLVLSNYNTSGASVELSPAIEFKSGTTASTSTTGFLLVTSGQQFEFHTANRGTKAFTVSSTGQVGDCTIDCGSY